MSIQSPSPTAGSAGSPLLAVGVAMISVQLGAAFAKGLFPLVGPEGVAALRVGISAIVLAVAFRLWGLRPGREGLIALVGYGAMLGLMNILIYKAFAHIPIGVAVSIEVIGPLAVATLASRRALDFVWIGLAVAGLCLLPLNGQPQGLSVIGVLFAMGAGVCWGLYIVFGARVAPLGAGRSVAAGMVVAAVITTPPGLLHAGPGLWSPYVLATGAVVALMSSMVPYVLDMYAMARMPRRVFGVLLSASPAMAGIAGLVILHETLTAAQWAGVTAIVLACAGAAWSARNHTEPAQA